MTDWEIREVDPADDGVTSDWHATYVASQTHGRPFATPFMLNEIQAQLRSTPVAARRAAYGGHVGGELVAAGWLELALLDNTSTAWFELEVRPDVRRRGLGSAMLDHLVAEAVRADRVVLATQAAYPYDAPADGAGQPVADFLRQHGFTFSLGDVQRVLDLPVAVELLDRLIAEAAPHHVDYDLRQFRGPVPDDIVASFGQLIGSLVVEAPMGEFSWEPEVFSPERIRADEAELAASGRTKYTTVALDRDGSCVAYSDIAVPTHDPGRAYQWGTLVAPGHRGHRLGQAVKAHNQRWLQQERPDLHRVITFNAEVNEHMIAVNQAMGFHPVERLGEFQRRL